MSNYKNILDYIYLSESSYADFSSARISNVYYYEEQVKKSISDPKDKGGIEKPESFSDVVTNNYTVEAHWKDRGTAFNSESGFSGTLFKGTDHNGGSEGYVLALKGTAGGKDLLAVDAGDIVNDGLAHHQITYTIH